MLDSRIDIEVIKKEFKNEISFIKALREQAIQDSQDTSFNRSYYEGKYVAFNFMLEELNSLYSHIMSSISIIQKYKN